MEGGRGAQGKVISRFQSEAPTKKTPRLISPIHFALGWIPVHAELVFLLQQQQRNGCSETFSFSDICWTYSVNIVMMPVLFSCNSASRKLSPIWGFKMSRVQMWKLCGNSLPCVGEHQRNVNIHYHLLIISCTACMHSFTSKQKPGI